MAGIGSRGHSSGVTAPGPDIGGMSEGTQRDARKCLKCGKERASVRKHEEGRASVYYQCLVCKPGWSPRRA
jgi:hypothetical protein